MMTPPPEKGGARSGGSKVVSVRLAAQEGRDLELVVLEGAGRGQGAAVLVGRAAGVPRGGRQARPLGIFAALGRLGARGAWPCGGA